MAYFYKNDFQFNSRSSDSKDTDLDYVVEGCLFWHLGFFRDRKVTFYLVYLTNEGKIDVREFDSKLIYQCDLSEVENGQYVSARFSDNVVSINAIPNGLRWGVLTKVAGSDIPDNVRQAFRKGPVRTDIKSNPMAKWHCRSISNNLQTDESISQNVISNVDDIEDAIRSLTLPKSQEEMELDALIEEMRPLCFTHSHQLSDYIRSHRLGQKYSSLVGRLELSNDDSTWNYDAGIAPKYYRRVCEALGLKNKGTLSRVTKFTAYKDM